MEFDEEATHAYLTELNRLVWVAEQARRRIDGRFVAPAGTPELACATRDIVSAAAGISRILWPDLSRSAGREVAAARGMHLRGLLGVEEDHPLISRDLRNHLEHFDERLDRIVAKRPGLPIYGSVVTSSRKALDDSHIEDDSIAFLFDKESDEIVVCGVRFSLSEVSVGCQDIAERLLPFRTGERHPN